MAKRHRRYVWKFKLVLLPGGKNWVRGFLEHEQMSRADRSRVRKMTPVVAELTLDDTINIAAYTGSRVPDAP